MATPRAEEGRTEFRTLGGRSALRFLRRGAPWAVAIALACGAVAFQVARVTAPTYEASIALLVSTPRTEPDTVVAPPPVAPGAYRSALWDGGIVAGAFEQVLGRELSHVERERLERTVQVSIDDQDVSSLVRVEVRHRSSVIAAEVANAIADGLVTWDRERAGQALQRRRAGLTEAVARLESRIAGSAVDDPARPSLDAALSQARADLAAATATAHAAATVPAIEPLRSAAPADEPVAPRPVFSTFVAFVLGLVSTYALLYLRSALDRRVGEPEAAQRLTGLPVLAEFPRDRSGTATREAAVMLRTRLSGLTRGVAAPTVLITSPRDPRAKDGVGIALAASLAGEGDEALLIDADVRHGDATRLVLGAPDRWSGPGTRAPGEDRPISVLAGNTRRYGFAPVTATGASSVEGPGEELRDRLAAWSSAYRTVIVEAGPLIPYADALAIAPWSTGVVLCLARETTTREDVLDALDLLDEQGVPVLGLVMTRRRRRAPARKQTRRGLARGVVS